MTIEGLCRLTGASPVTVRRDLTELASIGAVKRTHGGAARPPQLGAPIPFAVQRDADQQRKRALAAVVAGLIADEESIILDNGTTCFAVAAALAGRPVTALALSLHAAAALAATPGAAVHVPGGRVETDSLAFLGTAAYEAVTEVRVDTAVIGACAAAPEHGLTATTHEDARLKRASMRAARRTILVTVAEKLTRTSTFRFAETADLSDLVITRDAPAHLLDDLRAEGVRVHTVDVPA